ncbi:hypothetical protein [Paenibacillus taiwanensis]|uniref:hypothetical protein n=1 Tax=Paenibacillus taiwanensis TaxID=401638 RepID=UPI0004298443|nr:hypothetical protein [Paenibacillus taiwanensis]
MDNERVKRILKNYRSYCYAIKNGIAPFVSDERVGMPRGLSYGSRPPVGLSSGSLFESSLDYRQYEYIVTMIDGAVNEVLTDDERFVIQGHYLDRNPQLQHKLAMIRDVDESTIRRWHRKALKKLAIALEFVHEPEIINLDKVKKVS